MSERLDIAAIRKRLAEENGRAYWRSLEELADTPEFRQMVEDEFPRYASVWPSSVSRRRFLGLMGASLALAGLGGCTQPPGEKIVPYVRQPKEIEPGTPLFYATAMTLGGAATGVLAESHTGRPTKIEGNPQHPASRGATDLFAQASILGLYDPDRARTVTSAGEPRVYGDFLAALRPALDAESATRGAGIRILTETVLSPTLAQQLQSIVTQFPAARVHQWEPFGPSNEARSGAELAFARVVIPQYRFDQADTVLALDADFLACVPRNLRSIRDFAARRRVRDSARPAMSRLYAVEPVLSHVGGVADHRLPLKAAEVAPFAAAVATRLGIDVGGLASAVPAAVKPGWVDALARDLDGHHGRSLVVAGDAQPPVVHALAHAMNDRLGNAGTTVTYTDPVEAMPVDQLASLRELVTEMAAGRVRVLLILGANPAYTAPVDLGFREAILRVALPVHLGLHRDETSVLCRWHVPEAHYLEAWSDTRAADGTVSLVQPLIAPLYEGKSAHELLAAFTEQPLARGYDVVRGYWQSRHRGGDFDTFWRRALHDGVVPDSAAPPRPVTLAAGWAAAAARAVASEPSRPASGLEIVFRPHPHVWDGRFANNAWLQELPAPHTKVTWDNPVLLSPRTAERLHVASEDIVELSYRGRTVRAPAWIQPGHADDSITVHAGYGRTLVGRVGNRVGFNAYELRTSHAPAFDSGLQVRATGERRPIACTSRHHSMEGRDIVVAGTFDEYAANPSFIRERKREERRDAGSGRPLTLYPDYAFPTYAWGMTIDQSACTGCNACVVACYAENNVPVVGRDQVLMGRIMQWIRIDTYYTGSLDNPQAYQQPLPCMHCEKAPCEVVCPVAATVHSDEGLNEMVYNRCVGTRYCSNNCPYKVRRFNFLQYADWTTPSLKLQRNPDVTVRSRGVMEKCTYCVQRITHARVQAEREGRRIRDGEVITACAAACPTSAIVFGDLNTSEAVVRRTKEHPLNYALLDDLGTQPRTTYLAALRNPNPAIPRT